MKEAVLFGFLLLGFVVGLSAILYGLIVLFWDRQRRRTMRRKIRVLSL